MKNISSAPIGTVRSTCHSFRTDASAPSYRPIRTVVVVRPYEIGHLFSFFRPFVPTFPEVWNCEVKLKCLLHETYFFACSISFVILCGTIFFQSVFAESPENAFFAHRLILSCNDGPCGAIRLTFWQIVKWGILGGMVQLSIIASNILRIWKNVQQKGECCCEYIYMDIWRKFSNLWLYLSRNLKLYFLARSTIYWFLRGVMLISCEWKPRKFSMRSRVA